jgi:hypothetical protein
MFELEQELDIPSHLRFHILSKKRLTTQSHLSKVADGKRTTGYADEDFIAETNNKLHRRRNEAVCKKLLQRK